ncbi:MAG: hypothetical protein AB7D28_05440 [Candidatus Berkiella sp.]
MVDILTIKTIKRKLQCNSLPTDYKIKTPTTLTNGELVHILSLFHDLNQMINFIVLLSTTQSIEVQINNQSIALGSTEKFIHAYSANGLYPALLNAQKQKIIIEHFQKNKFTRSQLFYLIKNLYKEQIRDLILSVNCFTSRDLVLLCNDIQKLSELDYCTIKLLYHHFNPIRYWESTTTPLLDMYYFTYRAGHVLGLTKAIEIEIEGKKILLKPDGEYDEVSMKILVEKLEQYREYEPSTTIEFIYKAMKRSYGFIKYNSNEYKPEAAKEFLKDYHNKQLVYLSSGWYGHTVAVGLYGRFLVVANRGQACDPRYGTKIYTISNTKLINEKFIKALVGSIENSAVFNKLLSTVVGLNNPLVHLRSKPQKRGNCTFANPKSINEAFIILSQIAPFATDQELQTIALNEVRRAKYKKFTRFIRAREVDELIKNMFYAKNETLISFYSALVKAIIHEHHGKDRGYIKDDQEALLACELYERCPQHIKLHIKKDSEFMDLMKKLKEQREDIFYDRNWYRPDQSARIVQIYRGYYSHKVAVKKGYITDIDGADVPKMHFSYKMARRLAAIAR